MKALTNRPYPRVAASEIEIGDLFPLNPSSASLICPLGSRRRWQDGLPLGALVNV